MSYLIRGFTLSIALTLFNCSNAENRPLHCKTIHKSDIIEKSLSFNDSFFMDSCTFIPLETTEQSIIGKIAQVESFEGMYYIFDSQTRKIKKFNSAGKFVKDIGSIGKGPNEYLSASAFYINTDAKTIGLFDPYLTAIVEYTLDGMYLRTIKHNHYEWYTISRGTYCDGFIYATGCWANDNNVQYYQFSAKNLSLVNKWHKYPFVFDKQTCFECSVHSYGCVNGEFHYTSLFSDTIYSYIDGKEQPYICIESGKPHIPRNYFNNMDKSDPSKPYISLYLNKKYTSGCSELFETKRFMLTKFHLDLQFYLFDKKEHKYFLIKGLSFPQFEWPDGIDNNKLIKVITPERIADMQEELHSDHDIYPQQIKAAIKRINPESDNPILLIYYLKS